MGALPQLKYAGAIREVKIGKPGCEIIVGGETAYSFYLFEGQMPHPPRLALQVLDIEPEEWAAEALKPFADVAGDPVLWAKKCVEDYGADAICLWLAGTDPNGKNLSADHAAEVSRRVAEAVNVPLIVWGVSSDEKNTEVLKAVAESCSGLNLVLGPVTEGNYKQVGAAAIAYKQIVAANSPIDINLAKQLNILLENLGVPLERVLIDPTTGSVGYGMEYCYSIMERIRQAALTQNDDKLQCPFINNIAEEVWKTKEAKLTEQEDPRLGNPAIRGVNLEAITAISALQAGSDLLILRHPDTLRHVRNYLADLMIATDLGSMAVDLTLAPQAAATEPAKPDTAQLEVHTTKKSPKPGIEVTPSIIEKAQQPATVPSPETAEEAPITAEETSASQPSHGEATIVREERQGAIRRSQPPADADAVLTDEDIAALREMLAMFRAVKNLTT